MAQSQRASSSAPGEQHQPPRDGGLMFGNLSLPRESSGRQLSLPREESWQSIEHPSTRTEPDSFLNTSVAFNSQMLEELFPLKEMSDRISAKVEQFAIEVDGLIMSVEHARNAHSKEKSLRDIRALAKDFMDNLRRISEDEAQESHQSHATDLSQTWKRRVREVVQGREDSAVTNQDASEQSKLDEEVLAQIQDESDSWNLVNALWDLRYPAADVAKAKDAFIKSRGPITKSTSGSQLYERFMFLDDAAREKKIVLKWLEECAQKGEADYKMIIQKLEDKAGITKGTWTRGPAQTRETLKSIRTMGSAWIDRNPNPADKTPLVSRLDPDATAREGASFKTQDEYLERSLWLMCFAMVRQGRSWKDIRECFEDRNEGWRVVSIGRTGNESDCRLFVKDEYAGSLFRRMCFAAAQNSSADKYERAVYGLLAGDVRSVEPVCETWDDYLYAYYAALLISTFEEFLQQNCPDRVPTSLAQRFPMAPAVDAKKSSEIVAIVDEKAKSISISALKYVQGTIIADTFIELVIDVGVSIARFVNPEPEKAVTYLIKPTDREADPYLKAVIEDYNALRFIVHALIIWQCLSGRDAASDRENRYYVENLFVFYINYLRVTGKSDAIPIYAFFISQPRREYVVGTILGAIDNRKEQKQIVEIMTKAECDIPLMISYQIQRAMRDACLQMGTFDAIESIDILEPTNSPQWPAQRIKKEFDLAPITQAEEHILRACEWFNYINSSWRSTFEPLTKVMKSLLLAGHWSAALELTKRIPFHELSIRKSELYFGPGSGLDVFSPDDEEILLGEESVSSQLAPTEPSHAYSLRRSTRASTSRAASEQPTSWQAPPEALQQEIKRRRMTLELLRDQSRLFWEMQQLVLVLERLSSWRKVEDAIPTRYPGKEHREALNNELDELEAAMEPLLSGDFMGRIPNGKAPLNAPTPCRRILTVAAAPLENEQADYTALLQLYIPPILLAYASALVFAATTLAVPEHLLAALQLANAVASQPSPANPAAPDNSRLAAALAATGAMRPLVEALALASRALIRLNQDIEDEERRDEKEVGDGRRRKKRPRRQSFKKRTWMGQSLDLWDVTRLM